MYARRLLFYVIAILSATQQADADGLPPLEYRFKLGEELVYELTSDQDLFKAEEEPSETNEPETRHERKMRWNVYPVRQNEDGGWRLVVRCWVKLTKTVGDEEPYVRLDNTFLGYCDLQPDGSYAMNSSLGYNPLFTWVPEILFPPLPAVGDRAARERVAPTSGAAYTLAITPLSGDLVRLSGKLQRPDDDNYQITRATAIDFDPRLGRVIQLVEEIRSEWTAHPSHRKRVYTLVGTKQHEPDWLAQLTEESEDYFTTSAQWWAEMLAANRTRSEEDCRRLLSASREQLVARQKGVEIPSTRDAYNGLIALHEREAEMAIDAAKEREPIYARPPVDWATTNLAGELRTRTDYAGKVVILDFWYRGCGHCILALPKVKQLYAKYQDRSVVVLGVNNDRDPADALHVVETYSIPYESVRNVMAASLHEEEAVEADKDVEHRISSEYAVSAWPTFVVLDQRGRVAAINSGNSDDLVEYVSGVVDELLASPPPQ